MSEWIDSILDGIEEGLHYWERLNKLSKEYEKTQEKEVYTDKSLYKEKDENTEESKSVSDGHSSPPKNIVETELNPKGVFVPIQKKLTIKK